jgi:hypothetical protein
MRSTTTQGKALAKEVGAETFIPYSPLTQENLKWVFDECIKAALQHADGHTTGRGGGCVMS